jgi:hypothetical protein
VIRFLGTAHGADIRSVLCMYLGVRLKKRRRIVVVAVRHDKMTEIYICCKQQTKMLLLPILSPYIKSIATTCFCWSTPRYVGTTERISGPYAVPRNSSKRRCSKGDHNQPLERGDCRELSCRGPVTLTVFDFNIWALFNIQ